MAKPAILFGLTQRVVWAACRNGLEMRMTGLLIV
jgi:hypothetical protein